MRWVSITSLQGLKQVIWLMLLVNYIIIEMRESSKQITVRQNCIFKSYLCSDLFKLKPSDVTNIADWMRKCCTYSAPAGGGTLLKDYIALLYKSQRRREGGQRKNKKNKKNKKRKWKHHVSLLCTKCPLWLLSCSALLKEHGSEGESEKRMDRK